MDHHSRVARHSHAVPVFCRRATMALRTEHKGVGNRCPRVAHHDVCGIGCCGLQQTVFCFRKAPIVLPTMGCPTFCLCRGACLRCHDKSSYACASCSSAERNRPLVPEQFLHKRRATARHPCYHLLIDLRVGLRNRTRSRRHAHHAFKGHRASCSSLCSLHPCGRALFHPSLYTVLKTKKVYRLSVTVYCLSVKRETSFLLKLLQTLHLLCFQELINAAEMLANATMAKLVNLAHEAV